jgi:hypothetical protein
MFRTMKLRPRKKDCVVCGENPSITQLIDYVQFCGRGATDKVCITPTWVEAWCHAFITKKKLFTTSAGGTVTSS